MNTPEQRPIGSLKIPEFYAQIFGKNDSQDLTEHAKSIQETGYYPPLVIANQPDEDGKYVILKGGRTFLAAKEVLGYKVIQAVPMDVSKEDQPMRMILLNERKIITRRMLVHMFPVMEEYYQRVIRPTRPNNRDHNRDMHVWMSQRCLQLACPIGLRNIEKLKYINVNCPSLLDVLGSDHPIDPVWRKLHNELNSPGTKVPDPVNDNEVMDATQSGIGSVESDDELDSASEDSPHGQEEAMKAYFGKQFCHPCRANWIWFNRINTITPLEGGVEL